MHVPSHTGSTFVRVSQGASTSAYRQRHVPVAPRVEKGGASYVVRSAPSHSTPGYFGSDDPQNTPSTKHTHVVHFPSTRTSTASDSQQNLASSSARHVLNASHNREQLQPQEAASDAVEHEPDVLSDGEHVEHTPSPPLLHMPNTHDHKQEHEQPAVLPDQEGPANAQPVAVADIPTHAASNLTLDRDDA